LGDVLQFDNLVVHNPGWIIERITIFGYEESGGSPADDIAYHLRISLAPSFANPITIVDVVRSPLGTTYRNGDLVFDTAIALNPGNYYISAWVEQPSTSTKWNWRGTTPIYFNDEHWTHNPSGSLGFGTDPVRGSTAYGEARDLVFRIENAVPETGPIVVVGVGLALLRRRPRITLQGRSCTPSRWIARLSLSLRR